MYTEYFKLEKLPFTLTPDTSFFCSLKTYEASLETLLISLKQGDGFIKVIGDVGTGKTMLCRKLLNLLSDQYTTAYIPNPTLSQMDLHRMIIHELEGALPSASDPIITNHVLNQLLLSNYRKGKKVILIVDEAQALSDEGLEAVRLLTNLETENSKLLQVVLFGQTELEQRLNLPEFRQLKQRVIFSCYLNVLDQTELNDYVHHRLVKAGATQANLFSKKAMKLLYQASHGVPRMVNVLCHKALMAAYGRGCKQVSHINMSAAISDTFDQSMTGKQKTLTFSLLALAVVLVILLVELTLFR